MAQVERLLSAVGGRRFVMLLGGLYVASAVSYPFSPFTGDAEGGVLTLVGVLMGVPGLVLLVGGYLLDGTDIDPRLHTIVARWIGKCIGVVLVILALVVLVSDSTDIVVNTLILTSLGSLAGFGIGTHEAKSRTRELELEKTIEELQVANERLEQFAYAASHDLQEPLRMVSSYLQLLESRHGEELDGDAREFLEFAVDGADRMRAMVDSLLAYSRITSGGDPLQPTDAEAVFAEVRGDLDDRIAETGATVTADELPTVQADRNMLAQMLRNLLENALKYSGGAPPQVHVSVARDDDRWRFAVEDEGIGIEPAYQEQIFEVFETLHAGRGAQDVGASGVGLALCERIVERHDGEMWVESVPGEGATFYFTLYAAEAAPSATQVEKRPRTV